MNALVFLYKRILNHALEGRMARARSTLARTWSAFHRGVEGMHTLSHRGFATPGDADLCATSSLFTSMGQDTRVPHCVCDDSES
jgi:hypothetical protein